MNIFVTGLTSSAWGGMEFHNLGNFIITEPLFKELRKTFPCARISTGMQMSDAFYRRYDLVPLKAKRFWSYGMETGIATALDIVRLAVWKLVRVPWLLRSPMLKEVARADLVIDFSGDIYGDNARWTAYLEDNIRLIFAFKLKKKTAMIVGSPGPFSSLWRQWLAKKVMPRVDLITNREPLSTAMLAYVGIRGNHIRTTGCPSVLFERETLANMPRNHDYIRLFEDNHPTIGIIISGWNMPVAPFDRWPRENWEFDTFIGLISYLIEETEYRICLMSHQNGTDTDGKLIKGNDHRIIDRLIELLGARFYGERAFTLCGLYNAAQSKTIVSSFELLISGRIHGSVQGLSQGIPTAIIDYGHEPKAHKLRGFARVYGIDDLVLDPSDGEELKKGAEQLLSNADSLRASLSDRMPTIKAAALRNFSLLRESFEEDYSGG